MRRVTDRKLGEVIVPGFPVKTTAHVDPGDIQAPYLGEHNGEILGEVLGLHGPEVDQLRDAGILHSAEI